MIHWLVQSSTVHPDLRRGFAPPGLLHPREAEAYASLKTDKRRHDWLLGRWTSKLLVQAVVRQATGREPPLTALAIERQADGSPGVCWDWNYAGLPAGRPAGLPIHLSISHSGERSFCAAEIGAAQIGAPGLVASFGLFAGTSCPVGLIGVDIEQVEARPDGFIEQYFTETEIALVRKAPLPTRDVLITATWSAKEAALKALRLGLSVDARSVTCTIEPVLDPPDLWTPFDIQWDVRRLNRLPTNAAAPDLPPGPPALGGWWRVLDGCVLTLAAGETRMTF